MPTAPADSDATPERGLPPLYPVSLVVAGRPCLVVGGGSVAGHKVAGLVQCDAMVTVVAPEVVPAIESLSDQGRVTVHRRAYHSGEAARYRLVVTATGVPDVDGAVAADADAAGVWVNAADRPEHCSFTLPAVHRDGQVTVAVSTGGASPALASWLRHRIARAAGPAGPLATVLQEARRELKQRGVATTAVDWEELLEGPLPALVAQGRTEEARRVVADAVDRALAGSAG